MASWVGGIAGLATSFLWAFSATLYGFITRRVPGVRSITLAAIRATLGSLLLLLLHRLLYGTFWPVEVPRDTVLLLAASSLLSITLGDLGYFYGIAYIGPRLVTLLSSAAPLITTLLAWLLLGEVLPPLHLAGVAVAVGGVAWVVSEPRGADDWSGNPRRFRIGVALALSSTALVAASYVLSRAALNGAHFSLDWEHWRHLHPLDDGPPLPKVAPFSAAVIRVVTATAQGWLLLPFFGALRGTLAAFGNRRLVPLALAATLAGLVIGVWTAMVTLQYAPGGVGAALMNLSPIFMIPLTWLVFGERHSRRSIAGTVVAVIGVGLLLL